MIGKRKSSQGELRSSALWGTGNRGGDSRSNALWGKGGRGLVTALVAVLVVAAPLAAGARKGDDQSSSPTYIDPMVMAMANRTPDALVKVIIQSQDDGIEGAKDAFEDAKKTTKDHQGERVRRELKFVGSLAVELNAKRVLQLAKMPGLTVTWDAPVERTGTTGPRSGAVRVGMLRSCPSKPVRPGRSLPSR